MASTTIVWKIGPTMDSTMMVVKMEQEQKEAKVEFKKLYGLGSHLY
jgi:hypothetical protein